MALFQKKPQISSSAPLYTLGAQQTFLLVGLGNPGSKYTGSRHNVGYAIIDGYAAANDFPGWTTRKDLKSDITEAKLGQNRVLLLKPKTFMNLSGEAVQAAQRFYKIPNSMTIAVYDELAIPFGQLRTRVGGSDAGHNGVKSLIAHVSPTFGRLRVGIGGPKAANSDAAQFVLRKFSKEEQAKLPEILREANAILTEYVFGGQLPHDTRSIA